MWTDVYSLSNALQAVLAVAVAGVLAGQEHGYRRPAQRLWAIAWGASAVGLFASAITARLWARLGPGTPPAMALLALSGAGAAVQAGALLAGALEYASRPLRPRQVAAVLAACAIGGALLSLGAPGTLLGNARGTLLPLFTSAAFLWSARLLWRSGGTLRDLATAMAPAALAAYGLLRLAYPFLLFLSRTSGSQDWEPSALRELVVADSLLQSAVDFAMLLWLLREEHLKVEMVSGELRRVSLIDALTRLPNRGAFLAALAAALPRAKTEGRQLAVCLLDLDHFKSINDSLGPALGDEMLREMGRRLRATIPARAGIARLGGDDFAMLVPDPGPEPQIMSLAARLLDAVRRPLRLGAHELRMTASLGVAIFPDHGGTPEELLSDATLANSHASAGGGDREQIYAEALGQAARGQLSLTLALRRALDERQLVLHFQPIVSAASGRVHGFEALLRWQHPSGELLLPGDFLALAGPAGVADDLDDFVLRTACQKAAELRALDPSLGISVNLSARFFQLPGPVARVRSALEAAGAPPGALELEITETVAMRDAEETLAVLRELKNLGVRLTIDDFGTGFSSLSYLRRFAVDKLKIDKSFVQGIGTDPVALAVVEGILALAHTLKLLVVAEGVETDAQLEALKGMGCDLLQGYALGRPMAGERAAEALAPRRPA